MILEGLKLALLGMGVVFAFLGLLVVVIQLIARVLRSVTARELAVRQMVPRKRRQPRAQQEIEEKRRLLAIISAAIAAHRAREEPAQPPSTHTISALGTVGPRIPLAPNTERGSSGIGGKRRRFPGVAGLLFRDRSTMQVFLRRQR